MHTNDSIRLAQNFIETHEEFNDMNVFEATRELQSRGIEVDKYDVIEAYRRLAPYN